MKEWPAWRHHSLLLDTPLSQQSLIVEIMILTSAVTCHSSTSTSGAARVTAMLPVRGNTTHVSTRGTVDRFAGDNVGIMISVTPGHHIVQITVTRRAQDTEQLDDTFSTNTIDTTQVVITSQEQSHDHHPLARQSHLRHES